MVEQKEVNFVVVEVLGYWQQGSLASSEMEFVYCFAAGDDSQIVCYVDHGLVYPTFLLQQVRDVRSLTPSRQEHIGQVGLFVQVEHDDFVSFVCQFARKVGGHRRLACPAFLIDYTYRFHVITSRNLFLVDRYVCVFRNGDVYVYIIILLRNLRGKSGRFCCRLCARRARKIRGHLTTQGQRKTRRKVQCLSRVCYFTPIRLFQ